MSNIKNRIKENQRVQKIIENTKKKIKEEPFLKFTDKITFTASVIVMTLTQFFYIKYPQYLYLFYTVLFFPLLLNRFLWYNSRKLQGFMYDFNYFMHSLLIFYLYVYPRSSTLFQAIFSLVKNLGKKIYKNLTIFFFVFLESWTYIVGVSFF